MSKLCKQSFAIPNGLQPDGNPRPEAIPENMAAYGFSCPRQHFVESIVPVRAYELSRVWNVATRTIGNWIRDQDWKGQRNRYWLRCEALAGQMTIEAIAATRAKELHRRYDGWLQLAGSLEASIRRGGKDEQSATGAVKFTPFSPADWEKIAQAKERIERNIDAALAMNRVNVPIQEEAGSTPLRRRVLTMNLTMEQSLSEPADLEKDSTGNVASRNELTELPSPQELNGFAEKLEQQFEQMMDAEVISVK